MKVLDLKVINIQNYLPNHCLKELHRQKWYDENAPALTGNDLVNLYKMMTDSMTELQKHWIRAIIKKNNCSRFCHQEPLILIWSISYDWFKVLWIPQFSQRYGKLKVPIMEKKLKQYSITSETLYFRMSQQKLQSQEWSSGFVCRHVNSQLLLISKQNFEHHNILLQTTHQVYKMVQDNQNPQWIKFLTNSCEKKQQLVTILLESQQQTEFFDYYQTFITNQVDSTLAEELSKLSDRNDQQLYFQKIQDTVKTNILCFAQKRRIFNPLFHKYCKHYQQSKLLAMFSFDFVYNQITNGKQVPCFFPGCGSKFTKQNFAATRILSSQFRKEFYRQKMFYLLGEYQRSIYNDNHMRQKIIKRIDKYFATDLARGLAAKENDKILLSDCQLKIQGLIKSVSSKSAKKQQKLYEKIRKKYQEQRTQKHRFVQFYYDNEKSISACTFVQCKKCLKSLNQDTYLTNKYFVMDAWQVICRILFSNQQKYKPYLCNNCLYSVNQTKGLAQYLFLDLRVNKFFYIEGAKTRSFYYDCEKDQFVCKLEEYNGSQIKKKTLDYNSQPMKQKPKQFYYQYLPEPNLSKNKEYYVFYHINCFQNQKNNNNYFVYIPDNEKPQSGLKCPECQASLFVTNLYYDNQLTMRLKKNGNRINLEQNGQLQRQFQQGSNQNTIFKGTNIVLQYKHLRQKCFIYEDDHYIYSLNMSGKTWQKPIVLPCEGHSLQTRIIDFQDLKLFEHDLKDYVQCRNKNCQNIYRKKEDLFRIKGQTFTKELQQIQKKGQNKKGFWLCLDNKIQRIKRILTQQEVVKYRLDTNNLRQKKDICFQIDLDYIINTYQRQYQQLTANQDDQTFEDQTINNKLAKVVHFGNSFIFPYKIKSIEQRIGKNI